MIQYIASDLDGTLLQNGAQSLNPEVFDLIIKLKEKGIRFIAASGRTYANLRYLFEPVKDEISYIAENGSLCIHDGEVISRGLIERELGHRIIKASRKIPGCNCMLSCEDIIYTDSKDRRFLDHLTYEVHYIYQQVDDLLTVEKPFLKLAFCNFNGTDCMDSFFRDQFQSEISVVTSGNLWVDFIAPNANKGIALRNLTNHLGLKPENGIAFGDQYNDVEMLQYAGQSYAMANCAKGVEQYADSQTDSVEKIIKNILNDC